MATTARGVSSRAVQAERTRQQILDTAQRLFAEQGYDATSLQMIADELGLTKAAVYYHFPAKREILHAAMKPGIDRLEGLIAETGAIRGRRARIEHVVDGVVDFLVRNRRYAVMASTDPAAKRSRLDDKSLKMRQQVLALLYGDDPTPAARLAFSWVSFIPETLPELADLSDEQLREALQTTMLRVLRIPS
jgi:AcrR family transcriptional regulator